MFVNKILNVFIFLVLFLFLTNVIPAFAEKVSKTIKLSNGDVDLDEIAVNEKIGRVYIPVKSSNSIFVIDSKTNKKVGTIPLGDISGSILIGSTGNSIPLSIDLAINESTNKIYSANFDGKSVSVIDGVTNTVETTVSLNDNPQDIAVNSNINKIYTVNTDNSGSTGEVIVIDGATNNIQTIISITERGADQIVVNPATNKLYVSDLLSNEITVIDCTTNSIIKSLSVGIDEIGNDIGSLAVNQAQNKIYVSYDDSVFIIDGTTDNVSGFVKLRATPRGLDFNEVKSRLYVTDPFLDTVTVIDGSTNNILETTYVRNGVSSIAIDSMLSKAFVNGSNSTSVIEIEDFNTVQFTSENGRHLDALTTDLVQSFINIQGTLVVFQDVPVNVRPFRSSILSALKRIEKALSSSKIICGKRLSPALNQLKSVINATKSTNSNYFADNLKDDFDTIQEVIQINDINDGIPDVCGN